MSNPSQIDFNYRGHHLLVDALCVPGQEHLLNNLNIARRSFDDVARIAEMTIINQPVVIKFPVMQSPMLDIIARMELEGLTHTTVYKELKSQYDYNTMQNSGVTGFAVISESHCAFHTWPEASFFTFCLYSCKPFDNLPVLGYLQETFGLDPDSINVQVISRYMPSRGDGNYRPLV
jgi:S-adenosylmethionine/arginine decarboxylase-like enzyme